MDPAPETSRRMSAVRRRNTAPERSVQRCLSTLGYDFDTHVKELPGTPDIVFHAEKKAIFVHGCHWHRHARCKHASTLKTNTQYWKKKFAANVRRDKRAIESLRDEGWRVLVVWSCEMNLLKELRGKVARIRRHELLEKYSQSWSPSVRMRLGASKEEKPR